MLEALLLSLCFGSQMNNDACQQAMTKWREANPGFDEQMKFYQNKYAKELPVELLWSGAVANVLYKGQIQFGVYDGIYVQYIFKDDNRTTLGYKFSF